MSDPPARHGHLRAARLLRPTWIVAAVFAACSTFAPPTNVLITRTPPGDKAVPEEGASARLSRWQVGLAREGLKRGFFVVKSDLEWRALWPATDPDKVPLVPFDIDFAREMLLVSSPGEPDATASEVRSVIVTDRAVHVYVTQTVLGTDCPPAPDTVAKNYDLVRTPRIDDKDVNFHVDTTFGEPCGKPPEAGITCKPDGSSVALSENLSVQPGTKVVCVASGLKASRPIFDLTWIWDGLPIGSAAKVDVVKGSRSVTFVPDVIGTYRLALEVSDDLARKGKVTGGVEVPPPPGPLSVQLAWTKMEALDEPDTFPRIELHVLPLNDAKSARQGSGAGPADAGKPADAGRAPSLDAGRPPERSRSAWARSKGCTLASPLPWCTVKVAGPTTIMTLDPLAAQSFAIGVHYTDERVPGQPVLCVRAYRDGKMRTERCDPVKRDTDEWWDVGEIDSASGKTPETLAAEAAAAVARAAAEAAKAAAEAAKAAADAGIAEGGSRAPGGRVDGAAVDAAPAASSPR